MARSDCGGEIGSNCVASERVVPKMKIEVDDSDGLHISPILTPQSLMQWAHTLFSFWAQRSDVYKSSPSVSLRGQSCPGAHLIFMQSTLSLQHRQIMQSETDKWVCCAEELWDNETFRASLCLSPSRSDISDHFSHNTVSYKAVYDAVTYFWIYPSWVWGMKKA